MKGRCIDMYSIHICALTTVEPSYQATLKSGCLNEQDTLAKYHTCVHL